MRITTNTYPTNFGDTSVPEAEPYSRIVISIPVTRPVIAMSLKTFVPILLIVVCASLVYFVRPRYVEGRIGLGITALLTLVALQLTATAPLPDVDYLMMLDKIFLLAYAFIFQLLEVAAVWFIIRDLGIPIPLVQLIVLVQLMVLVTNLPITWAGVGTR